VKKEKGMKSREEDGGEKDTGKKWTLGKRGEPQMIERPPLNRRKRGVRSGRDVDTSQKGKKEIRETPTTEEERRGMGLGRRRSEQRKKSSVTHYVALETSRVPKNGGPHRLKKGPTPRDTGREGIPLFPSGLRKFLDSNNVTKVKNRA